MYKSKQNKYCDKWCDGACCGFIEEDLIALSSQVQEPNIFVESQGKNKISLRLWDKYLSVQPSGVAAFDASEPRQDTTFVVEKFTDDEIALKSVYNKYLSTDRFGCFSKKWPTFTSSSRGRSEMWKVKCKTEEGKNNEIFLN